MGTYLAAATTADAFIDRLAELVELAADCGVLVAGTGDGNLTVGEYVIGVNRSEVGSSARSGAG